MKIKEEEHQKQNTAYELAISNLNARVLFLQAENDTLDRELKL